VIAPEACKAVLQKFLPSAINEFDGFPGCFHKAIDIPKNQIRPSGSATLVDNNRVEPHLRPVAGK
jgi:hypothetical protein